MRWGLGVNRIADLRVYEECKTHSEDFKTIKNCKYIHIHDHWNKNSKHNSYSIVAKFAIFDPLYQKYDEMWLETEGQGYYFDPV